MNKIVLLVHQSAEMYGSDKVLLLLAQGLKNGAVFVPVVVLPEMGPLHGALLASSIEVHIGAVGKISRSVLTPTGLPKLARETLTAIRGIDKILAGREVAVVHSNTLAVAAGAAWAFLRRKKHLWHVHEIIMAPKLASKMFPFLTRVLADRVIANSTLTEKWLVNEQPKLATRSKVVFNGLPEVERPAAADVEKFRRSIGAIKSDVVITLAGRINKWKGQALLLTAAAELKRRGSGGALKFVIVGDAASGLEYLPEQLRAQAETDGLSPGCTFVPFVDDIWPIWFGTDIAVVPSTEPEPFGMVAIEAMAAGVPVVAAGHGGLLDIVMHNETGLLFEPRDALALADALERLVSDPALRQRLGDAGANRQREIFSVESQVALTESIYLEMIS